MTLFKLKSWAKHYVSKSVSDDLRQLKAEARAIDANDRAGEKRVTDKIEALVSVTPPNEMKMAIKDIGFGGASGSKSAVVRYLVGLFFATQRANRANSV